MLKRGPKPYEPTPQHLQIAYLSAKKGLSEAQIAAALGLDYRRFQRHKHYFIEMLKKGRDESDDSTCEKVESALVKTCCGYEYEEKQIEKWTDDNGVERIKQRVTKKHAAPVIAAIIFYLCNRMPDRWKQMIREAGPNGNVDNLDRLTVAFQDAASAMKLTTAPKTEDKKNAETKKHTLDAVPHVQNAAEGAGQSGNDNK